jgi:hypothetical protein
VLSTHQLCPTKHFHQADEDLPWPYNGMLSSLYEEGLRMHSDAVGSAIQGCGGCDEIKGDVKEKNEP